MLLKVSVTDDINGATDLLAVILPYFHVFGTFDGDSETEKGNQCLLHKRWKYHHYCTSDTLRDNHRLDRWRNYIFIPVCYIHVIYPREQK